MITKIFFLFRWVVPACALFGGAPLGWGALSGLGRRAPPGASPSGSAVGVLVVTGFGSGVVVSRPLPPVPAALASHRHLTSIALLAPLASLQTPSASNPSQARGLLQTAPYASARSARRFHAARIGGRLAVVRSVACLQSFPQAPPKVGAAPPPTPLPPSPPMGGVRRPRLAGFRNLPPPAGARAVAFAMRDV